MVLGRELGLDTVKEKDIDNYNVFTDKKVDLDESSDDPLDESSDKNA
jgi:hypothetical protein